MLFPAFAQMRRSTVYDPFESRNVLPRVDVWKTDSLSKLPTILGHRCCNIGAKTTEWTPISVWLLLFQRRADCCVRGIHRKHNIRIFDRVSEKDCDCQAFFAFLECLLGFRSPWNRTFVVLQNRDEVVEWSLYLGRCSNKSPVEIYYTQKSSLFDDSLWFRACGGLVPSLEIIYPM